jgi:(5-formylfuran-3-yl)methyl phosphate synthase
MQLLISVTNTEEAQSAAVGGADIVDIKNPSEGALGANFPHIIRAIRQEISTEIPVSVAIGDAPNKPGATALAALGAASCCDIQFVKVGLYGTSTTRQAVFLLKEVCRAVRDYESDIKIIAVAYADAHKIGAFPVMESPAVAVEAGADGCLLDTAGKTGESLFSHLDDTALQQFVQDCQRGELISALAGSLGEADIPRLLKIGPDILGFRTAACKGDRVTGVIQSKQVERLKRLINGED